MTNISNDELLDELFKRVIIEEIKNRSIYYYETDKIVARFETDNIIKEFITKLDIERQFRYYKNYETFCLPFIEEKQERKNNKKIEILKTKINQHE